jgi:hypothetical protein
MFTSGFLKTANTAADRAKIGAIGGKKKNNKYAAINARKKRLEKTADSFNVGHMGNQPPVMPTPTQGRAFRKGLMGNDPNKSNATGWQNVKNELGALFGQSSS